MNPTILGVIGPWLLNQVPTQLYFRALATLKGSLSRSLRRKPLRNLLKGFPS